MWSRLFRAAPWCPTPLDPGCRAIQHHLHSWQQHTTTIGQAKSSLSFAFKFTFLWWTLSSLQRIAWHTPKSRMVNANTPHNRRLHQCGSKIFEAPLQPVAQPCILDQLTMNFGCGSSDQILRRGPRRNCWSAERVSGIKWIKRPRSPSSPRKVSKCRRNSSRSSWSLTDTYGSNTFRIHWHQWLSLIKGWYHWWSTLGIYLHPTGFATHFGAPRTPSAGSML